MSPGLIGVSFDDPYLERSVRDQLSGDTWMVLGATDRAVAELSDNPGDSGMTLALPGGLAPRRGDNAARARGVNRGRMAI